MNPRMSAAEYRTQPKAKARFPRGIMNQTEAAYAQHLELRKRAGDIADYRFEALTFKLVHDTRYTPDFLVVLVDGSIEFHEAKGFMREDAHVKIKVAAALFPWFRFLIVRRSGTKASPIWSAVEVPST